MRATRLSHENAADGNQQRRRKVSMQQAKVPASRTG
jgi:hypothetical protein